MTDAEKESLIALYENRYEELGYSPKSVGWGDEESQILRFSKLADIADLKGKSICDIGCGFGDLYPYLQKRFGSVKYLGYDLSPKLIHAAKMRYSQAEFETKDIITDTPTILFDYVLCSGALSYKTENHMLHVRKMLSTMYTIAREGVGVNFLSTYVDFQLEKNFHFAPEDALSMAKELTRYVSIRHDYPLYEFTLFMYHKAQ